MDRVKLADVKMDPETMVAIDRLVMERLTNFGLQLKRGHPPMAVILGEITVLETKLDALMHLLEDKSDVHYKMFDAYMQKIAVSGIERELEMRKTLTAPTGPQIIKP